MHHVPPQRGQRRVRPPGGSRIASPHRGQGMVSGVGGGTDGILRVRGARAPCVPDGAARPAFASAAESLINGADMKRALLAVVVAAMLPAAACVSFKDKHTPSGDFCSDMAVVPAGQEPDREYHRLQPIQSDPKARTEAERLESLRKAACNVGADAVIEAVNEEVRGDNASYGMVSSGTAVILAPPRRSPRQARGPGAGGRAAGERCRHCGGGGAATAATAGRDRAGRSPHREAFCEAAGQASCAQGPDAPGDRPERAASASASVPVVPNDDCRAPLVRLAVPGDAAAIARVQVESWHAAYAGLMPAAVLDAFTVEKREPRWKAILTRDAPAERTLVIAPGGVVAGFASTGPSRDEGAMPDVAELYALYLAPGSWGTGLGRALLAAAIEELRARGYASMTLWVLDGNARARRFYEAAGMRADGAVKVEIEEGAELPHTRYGLPLGPGRR